jgi:hypothetical protein
MESSPLFIVGSPRSGTTFLCSVLNAHPLIQLTNECRIFALLKDTLDAGSNRPDLLSPACHDRFSSFSRRTLGAWVERFYREELEMTAPVWGDKHPSYADPTVLSGRTGIADLYVLPDAPTGGDKLLALAGTTATHLGYGRPNCNSRTLRLPGCSYRTQAQSEQLLFCGVRNPPFFDRNSG